ncbi:Peptidase S9, prolyl oligopeptidase active site region precursor [Myxococcus hansupus]|uniref:Acyl-peptide hydrolase n=1 Tax=Pseudomyxococcus hansupus TaxID=1297742 RepID=A0A0H4WMI0_9BACT|nr:S9 family peptidase [Myxococcus hansupus]AKQ64601.1 Peptidase S9, prolyl oligopeptidase active site region precursor [Myxococcus hansupus]
MTAGSTLARALVAIVILPALALAVPRTGTPRPPGPSPRYTVEQFMETTAVRGASFSSDEQRVLYSSNETGVFNVFSVPVAGGKPVQLTRSLQDATFAVGYFPTDDRVLFTRDSGGNELPHLYVRTSAGQEQDLTPGDKHHASFFGWSQDGGAFYVLSNERDARVQDLYRYDAKTYARSLIYAGDGEHVLSAISPDEKWLALEKSRTLSDSDVFLLELATQQRQQLTAHTGSAHWKAATFDPSSSSLYLLTNEGSEFIRVERHVLATGKREQVEALNWDVLSTAFSRRGTWRVTRVNEDGRTTLRVHDVKTGKRVSLPGIPEGALSDVTLSRDEKRMAFHVDGDRAPGSLYVYDLETKKATRLTNTLGRTLNPQVLVESERVRFKSFDGLEIPALLYKPHQATAKQRAPAIVFVHGGPGGQSSKGYSSFFQTLVHHGYVVLAVNNRGSEGYGKSFFAADDQQHGKAPLQDCVEAKKYLTGLPYVDGARVGILGPSYGGYMVLAALAFHPDVFAVGVDAFGISDWLSALKALPPHKEALREALYQELGNPQTQEAMLRDISPLFHAEKIRKPLLVIQGANDPRVPKASTDALVETIRKNGVPIDYFVLPNDGHGFSSTKSEAETTLKILSFLDQHLRRRQ